MIPLGPLGQSVKDHIVEGAKDQAHDLTYDIITGILDGLRDLIVDFSYSIALIGGGLSIIFWVAGWEKGKRMAGILTVAYALIKYLLG